MHGDHEGEHGRGADDLALVRARRVRPETWRGPRPGRWWSAGRRAALVSFNRFTNMSYRLRFCCTSRSSMPSWNSLRLMPWMSALLCASARSTASRWPSRPRIPCARPATTSSTCRRVFSRAASSSALRLDHASGARGRSAWPRPKACARHRPRLPSCAARAGCAAPPERCRSSAERGPSADLLHLLVGGLRLGDAAGVHRPELRVNSSSWRLAPTSPRPWRRRCARGRGSPAGPFPRRRPWRELAHALAQPFRGLLRHRHARLQVALDVDFGERVGHLRGELAVGRDESDLDQLAVAYQLHLQAAAHPAATAFTMSSSLGRAPWGSLPPATGSR